MFQFEVVNAISAGDTVASPVSAEVIDMSTSVAGFVSSTMVNESVVASSDTDAVVFDNVNPTVSSSTIVNANVGVMPSPVITMVQFWLPSSPSPFC